MSKISDVSSKFALSRPGGDGVSASSFNKTGSRAHCGLEGAHPAASGRHHGRPKICRIAFPIGRSSSSLEINNEFVNGQVPVEQESGDGELVPNLSSARRSVTMELASSDSIDGEAGSVAKLPCATSCIVDISRDVVWIITTHHATTLSH